MDISLRDLTKTYTRGVRALDGVSLDIRTGTHGLLGGNGAGKTTLMRILAGVIPPTSGHVLIAGNSLDTRKALADYQRSLGYLPQDLGLYPNLTARECLDYIALLKEVRDPHLRRARISTALDSVGLSAKADDRIRTFSGGMKRRLGIAQAIVNDPGVLIVDEPTAGLDPQERIRFRSLLAELASERTVLLSTHIVDDIAQTCPRLSVLAGGRVIFHGTTTELVQRATGRVWTIQTDGRPPTGQLQIITAVNHGTTTEYRVIADTPPHPAQQPLAPTLEDGYAALLRDHTRHPAGSKA
jgi:ABC-2 type transport system ATP-binding protein